MYTENSSTAFLCKQESPGSVSASHGELASVEVTGAAIVCN